MTTTTCATTYPPETARQQLAAVHRYAATVTTVWPPGPCREDVLAAAVWALQGLTGMLLAGAGLDEAIAEAYARLPAAPA